MIPDFKTIAFPKPLWIKQVFDIPVEWHEIPRLGNAPYYPIPVSTGFGGLHDTEGSSVNAAINAMEAGLKVHKGSDPCHFICGENRIVQTRPVGVQAASMRDPANRRLTVQIENCGFAKQTPWRMIDSTREPCVKLLAYCALNFGIPLIRPLPFPDDCSDIKGTIWASISCKRRLQMAKIWATATGWINHLEAIQNVHWDTGSADVSVMLSDAQVLVDNFEQDNQLTAAQRQ